jgi:Mg2+ and Co2+ transporter CorA
VSNNGCDMPWPILPSGPPPLVEWRGDAPPPDGDLPDGLVDALAHPGARARLVEVDGHLCATLIATSFAAPDPRPSLERVDLVLMRTRVIVRRRPVTGECSALAPERLAREWARTPPAHRDPSVLFLQILNAVVDASSEVVDEVRHRVGLLEERLLAPNPPLNRILAELLELNRHLGTVRDGLLPLRSAIRELGELRDPVSRGILSAAGGLWLRSIELDLRYEVPSSLAVAESRIAGAFAQLQGERSEATNRVVLLLTIITVAFFLPTLLTGLYGMNVPLPGQESEGILWAFIGVAGLLLAVAAVAITRLGLWGTFWSVVPGLPVRPTSRDHQTEEAR